MSELEFPDVFRAELDAEQLGALFDDLTDHAEVIEVRAKDAARDYARAAPLTLDEARRLVVRREVRGVQVRYRHGGALWMDTLMPGPTRVRLVRMQVPV